MSDGASVGFRSGRALAVSFAVFFAMIALGLWQLDDSSRIGGVEAALDASTEASQKSDKALQAAIDAEAEARAADNKAVENRKRIVKNKLRIDRTTSFLKDPGEPFPDTLGQDGKDGLAGLDGSDGDTGDTGATGPGPSAEEIAAAIASYCAERNECAGPQGTQGDPGPPPTAEQLDEAVAAYLSGKEFQCAPNTDPPGTFTCTFP